LKKSATLKSDAAITANDAGQESFKNALFDPFGLYSKDAPERKNGMLQPLEADPVDFQIKEVTDPLNLYQDTAQVSTNVEMSASLPFLKRPAALDGSMAGDRGFDPFNFSSNSDALAWYRNSELKHARLAMLAAVGWPLAELFHNGFAEDWGLPQALNAQDRVPSVLNGGLGDVSPMFWVAALAAAAIIETSHGAVGEIQSPNLGFDPLGLSGNHNDERAKFMEESELFNGRLAMLAITGFAIQEWFTNDSVVDAIPIFFKPMNIALEQLLSAAASV
jgi:hypothetical protein